MLLRYNMIRKLIGDAKISDEPKLKKYIFLKGKGIHLRMRRVCTK